MPNLDESYLPFVESWTPSAGLRFESVDPATAHAEADPRSAIVRVHVASHGVALRIWLERPEGGELAATRVVVLPIRSAQPDAAETGDTVQAAIDPKALSSLDWEHAVSKARLYALAYAATALDDELRFPDIDLQIERSRLVVPVSRRGTRLSDELLQVVAQDYRNALSAGVSTAKYISDKHHISPRTAPKWVMEARDRGFLPRTERGQARG